MKKHTLFLTLGLSTTLSMLVACGSSNSDSTGNGSPGGDSAGNLKWSDSWAGSWQTTAEDAASYCSNLGGRLPTISELRTLVKGCPGSEPGGACGVTDACLQESCGDTGCDGCGASDKYYSVFNDTGWYWSSSPVVDTDGVTGAYWFVSFYYGSIKPSFSGNSYMRCIMP